jgi:hypothetical protein
MAVERSVIVVGAGLILGFLVALYGFFNVVAAQAYMIGRQGLYLTEGSRAVFLGLFTFGAGLLVHLQSIGYMERRYHRKVKRGSIGAMVAIGVGLVGFLLLTLSGS